MPRPAGLLFLFLLTAPAALGAEAQAPPSLRELVLRAGAVVQAAPLDQLSPTRFRVVEVLGGNDSRDIKVGSVLSPDVGLYQVQTVDPAVLPETAPAPRRISTALLFLEPAHPKGGPPRLCPCGLWLCVEDGRVLAPVPSAKPPFPMEVRTGIDWPTVRDYVKQDLAVVRQVEAVTRLTRSEQRARGLLDWLVRHRREIGVAGRPGPDGEVRTGWSPLERRAFEGALNVAQPAEAWAAVRLYAEVFGGARPPLRADSPFTGPQGRDFLLRTALDDSGLLGDRTRALDYLADPLTLGLGAGRKREAKPLDARQRDEMLDQLVKLLDGPTNPAFRVALVRCLVRLSKPEERDLPATTRILDSLVNAYQEERPGPSRDELALAVCILAPPERWKELTGNPPGVLVCLRDLERGDEKMHFWLSLQPSPRGPEDPAVLEQPKLVLERLGPLGFVAETKQSPLEPVNLPRPWKEGWTGTELLYVEFPLKGLSPGNWRVRVQGTAGKEKLKWNSEPRKFVIPAAPRPGGPLAR